VPALIGLREEQDRLALSEARDEVYQLILKVKRADLLLAIEKVCGRSKDKRATSMRLRLADLFALSGDRKEACRQLITAMSMSPNLRAAVAFKLGYQLAMMHEYFGAYPYIDLACKLTQNPNDAEKYRAFRRRIARIGLNSPRDIALWLKVSMKKP
jgi:hypothetical protein